MAVQLASFKVDVSVIKCVERSECPESHQDALNSQWRMGWKHVFTGHISQEWEKLQGDVQTDKKTQKATDWTLDLVTILLQQVVTLWEVRKEELHGKTNQNRQ